MRKERTFAVVTAVALALILGAANVSAAVRTATFRVKGMTCQGCAVTIEQALKATAGVLEARVSYENGRAWVKYEAGKVNRTRLRKVIEETGFQVASGPESETEQGPETSRPSSRRALRAW
jgi:copper chaperone CopZ